MKAIVVAALLMAATSSAALTVQRHQLAGYTFDRYLSEFGKSYTGAELTKRRVLFEQRLKEIIKHNSEGHSWWKTVNHLTDLTDEERRAMRGRRGDFEPKNLAMPPRQFTATGRKDLPSSLDWRLHQPTVVSAVKNQGMCGSCWAHAATEEVESMYALKTGSLYILSQQQITSCTPNPDECGGSGGCYGATVEVAWNYTTQTGLTEEWQYGYKSFFGDTTECEFGSNSTSKAKPVVKTNGYTVILPRNKPQSVMEALATVGPLAISVDASGWSDYGGGIFTGCDYAKNITMDHAVQLVGYGHDISLKKDYWLVRNSWSGSWGEYGYIRLYKESGDPECGWDVEWRKEGGGCKNQSNSVWSCGQCGILYDNVYPNVY